MDEKTRKDWLEMCRLRVVDRVLELYGTEDFVILDAVPVLWSGWECDAAAVLVRLRDNSCHIVICEDTMRMDPRTRIELLQDRIAAYWKAIDETQAFIARARSEGVR